MINETEKIFISKNLILKRKLTITNDEILLKRIFKEKMIRINNIKKITLIYRKSGLRRNRNSLFKIDFSFPTIKHIEFKVNGFSNDQKSDLESLFTTLANKHPHIQLSKKLDKLVGFVNGVPIFREEQSELRI